MGWVFLICALGMVILGYVLPDEGKGLEVDVRSFKTHGTFTWGAAIVLACIAALYWYFW
jgi:SSS family solute:Na+ symporter